MTGKAWTIGDEVRKGDDVGIITDIIGEQPLSFRLAVLWDGGGDTLEIASTLTWTGNTRPAEDDEPEYMPGARVKTGVKRSGGTVERAWFDDISKQWKYDVTLDADRKLVTVTGDALSFGTLNPVDGR